MNVKDAQKWLNEQFDGSAGWVHIDEDGVAGYNTMVGFVRALQILLRIDVDGGFGNGTKQAYNNLFGDGLSEINNADNNFTVKMVISLVNLALLCRIEVSNTDDISVFSEATRQGIISTMAQLGIDNYTGGLRAREIKALFTSDAYYLISNGDATTREIQQAINLKNEQTRLTAIVQPKLKKVKNSIDKISLLLKKRDNTEKYKLYGELLTANLYRKCDFQKSIEVFDYINNQNIIIELDPIKTLNENAQRYFKLYTKSKMTKEKSKEMLENLNMEKDYLENILYSINNAVEIKDFEDIKAELGIDEIKPKKQEQSALMKYEIKGFDVYVGRNNRQNDYIISKLAKDEDYWFHARLCAGSHVLLKTMGREPEEEVLFECCKLARQYSSASLPSKVGIIYTKAKNLRKPPAAPLGYVTYKNEKEVLV